MKLSYRDIDSFLKRPNPLVRVVLVYGPDYGLMKERIKQLSLTVVSDLNDPFNVAVLSTDILSEDPARLNDEAHAISMMGGQRLIRIEGGSDKLTSLIQSYLEDPSDQTLVLIEGDDMGPRSSLRKLCEKEKNAAALPCYVEDERDVSRLIRQTMEDNGLRIVPDAMAWLASHITGDRKKVRQEMEKVVLYKYNDPTPVTLDDVQLCCGTLGDLSLDDLVFAVTSKNARDVIPAYQVLVEDGVNFIVILRSLQNHLRRLHLTKTRIAQGETLDQAMQKLRPPVFFKRKADFIRQVNAWTVEGLSQKLDEICTLEADCKTTGFPVETVCERSFLS